MILSVRCCSTYFWASKIAHLSELILMGIDPQRKIGVLFDVFDCLFVHRSVVNRFLLSFFPLIDVLIESFCMFDENLLNRLKICQKQSSTTR